MGEVPSSPDSENPEIDFKNLKFGELEKVSKEIQRLAATTFHQTSDESDDVFRNVMGEVVSIRGPFKGGIWKLFTVSQLSGDVHGFLCGNPNSVLCKGSTDREEMVKAMRAMLEGLGCRIIE